MIKQIKKQIKQNQVQKYQDLYLTTFGSLVVTLGILSCKSEKDMYKKFKELKADKNFREKELSVQEIVNYVDKGYSNLSDEMKQHILFVYDEDNIRSPMFTYAMFQDRERVVYPLRSDGTFTGILQLLDRDNIIVQGVF